MNTSDLQVQAAIYGKKLLQHHVIIVMLLLLASLLYTVFAINQIISGQEDEEYRAEQQAKTTSTKFDEETIDRIQQLKSTDQTFDLSLPPGRINPFTE